MLVFFVDNNDGDFDMQAYDSVYLRDFHMQAYDSMYNIIKIHSSFSVVFSY